MFSPRARGCSRLEERLRAMEAVFPACAGMFRSGASKTSKNPSFPRVRGDVPGTFRWSRPLDEFSPRARGCSAGLWGVLDDGLVFPAYAGMFPPL